MTARIELTALRRLIAEQAQLVEVLPPAEYAEAHLPSATNIPLSSNQTVTAPRGSTGSSPSLSTAGTTPET